MLLFVLPITTSVEEQGIYYALLGLFSLFAFADLGLSSALINFVSHQKQISLEKNQHNNIVKSANLARLIIFAFLWGVIGSILLGIITYLIGIHSLKSFFTYAEDLHFSLIIVSIMNIFFFQNLIFFSILEGLNLISKMFFYRCLHMFLFITGQLIFLFFEFSYKSLVYAQAISTFLVYCLLIFCHFKQFFTFALESKKEASISVLKDVIPFQTKVATSWIFGFLPIQIMPTLIATTLGLAWSAKIGMTQQIITAVSATAFIFIQVIVPKLGELVSQKNNIDVFKIYKRSRNLSLLTSILGILGLIISYFILQKLYVAILNRIVPLDMLILFLSLIIVNWITFARAALARVFHIEVMFWPTVFSGSSLIFLLIFSKFLTPNEFVFYYVTIAWASCIGLGSILFKSFISKKVLNEN